jgi:hypothetical protein
MRKLKRYTITEAANHLGITRAGALECKKLFLPEVKKADFCGDQ